ncbi:STAS domain-containing protein [Polynucleobacter sp. MWH-Spelu-300-X4]|uniref:SulP family inorganic anion transporter n=1 Tax=Polynucleobacter sp. MWH-Spelu-300-X4 TaxID=2689109 RepID=UPI001BFCE0E8|nr:SulP family inorganic anion transporter [Polynucleobacter sp. MWH-Spelu-300-X4]QWD80169.1 STAS domain-containing protein [Polynucleobacter sp. MWH-Spelu-300-X4]
MIHLARFRPKIVDAAKGYSSKHFVKDLSSGITVGVIALPLAIAFAIASGLKPEAGLISAVIGGFLISAFGGSKVQIGGPAGAFVVIVYGIVERYGVPNLILSTFLAGSLLFTMGLLRVGNLIRFIPVAIIIGFTSGIAVLIGLSQIRDAFGLEISKLSGDFFSQIHAFAVHANTANPYATLVCAGSLLIIILWPKIIAPLTKHWPWLNNIPGIIVALMTATVISKLLELPITTIGTRFGSIPNSLPTPTIPNLDWETAKYLFAPTLTIAILGAIESLLCARVADNLSDDKHNPNQELMGQGIANMIVPFFGGLPVTGTIARTATNAKAGAQSPISGIIHSIVILSIMVLAAPLAVDIPLAALAAILIYIAWNMFDIHEFKRLKQFNLTYRSVLLGTFFLTVIFDLTVAVEAGLVLACIFFIYRISSLTQIESIALPDHLIAADDLHLIDNNASRPTITAYKIYGSLFFGAIDKIENLYSSSHAVTKVPQVMILEMHQLINIDTSGIDSLKVLDKELKKSGGTLLVCAANEQPASLMTRSGFIQQIGEENSLPDLESAFERAREISLTQCKLSIGS